MITRDELESRLAQRRAQERQAFANFNAAHGAVQELEELLKLVDAEMIKNEESQG